MKSKKTEMSLPILQETIKQQVERTAELTKEAQSKLADELESVFYQLKGEYKKITDDVVEYYENIIALMPGHVYWQDVNNVFLGCNDLQAKHARLASRKDIIGKTNYDMPWKEQAQELNKVNSAVMRTGQAHVIEEFAVMANGPRTYLSQKVPLRNKSGHIIGVLGISFDITDQKESEQLRLEKVKAEQAQKDAEQATKRMKELAFTIAHEMRTPLASVSGFVDSAYEYILSLLNIYEVAEQRGFLSEERLNKKEKNALKQLAENVQCEVKKAFLTINLLLENIKQEEFNYAQFSACSIAETIEQAVARYPMDEEQRLHLHLNLEQDFLFFGNAELLTHVIFNLLKNALYYTAYKGEIFIKSVITETQNELHFKDTGEGISPEVLPYIFQQFYSTTYQGTGLGLPFCKRVMEGFNGQISYDSVKGEYTEFVLIFPKVK